MSNPTDRDQRYFSSEDKNKPLTHTDKFLPRHLSTVPLRNFPEDPNQSPSQIPSVTVLPESPVIAHPASNISTPPKSCLDLYPQFPLPGKGRVAGRHGVSFCFSRKGPRLEPSAPVFSDLEEEEREKREQMKQRIKGIMEDICREIRELEGRKHNKSEKFKTCSEGVGSRNMPILREPKREEEDAEKASLNSIIASDNQNPSSLFGSSQTLMTIWDPAAHTDTVNKDNETEKKQESKGALIDSQYLCVLGKDGSTCLRWPRGMLKFTKSQPRICYSHNPCSLYPQNAGEVTDIVQAAQQNQLSALTGESDPCVPDILTPDSYTCLEREMGDVPRKEKIENFKVEEQINVETEEHLCLKNKNLLSSETKLDKRGCTNGMENSVGAVSHSFDPTHSDSPSTNSQNPQGGRLGGTAGIREKAITALSGKLESVVHTGKQEICISLSRCECGSETTKASTKKHRLKKKRDKREKALKKHLLSRRKVRSVVSAVSNDRQRIVETGENWGKKRRQGETRKRVKSVETRCLLGRNGSEPVYVSVRKRRPHRSYITKSQSEAEREQAKRCSASSQLSRHIADRDTTRERRRERDAVTFPWRTHFSLNSLSSGCNSELFGERGRHSNPRSFIECCYPDNSCGCSPARKRKVLHGDRLLIHCKRKNLRQYGVWEEKDRGKNPEGHLDGRDSLTTNTKQWDWMRGNCSGGWRSRNTTVEWDRVARFSPSPSRWSKGSRPISTDDADWDRCSMDRWTWGSTDSCEDKRTHRAMSGNRDSPDPLRKCAGTRQSNLKHFSSPDWWTSRQTYNHHCVSTAEASRGHSPRSCSPCSSTSISELSWEWSRSSTCSGVAMHELTDKSSRTSSGTQGLTSERPKEAKKQNSPASSGLSSSSVLHSSLHRSPFTPTVTGLNTHHCDTNSPLPKEPKSQSDLSHESLAHVTTNRSDATPGLSPDKLRPQKSVKMLLLPLIGKIPAIQQKEKRKKELLERSQGKKGEDEAEANSNGRNHEVDTNCPAETNPTGMPNLCLSQIRIDDKQPVGETTPPISFTAEEMDKYRCLQEQAREHMQKVLEQTQESADTHTEMDYTHMDQPDNCGTSEEHYTAVPLHNPPQPQIQSIHTETVQTQAQHTLQVNLPFPHVTSPENFSPPVALGVPNLLTLPLPSHLSSLHHIILQPTEHSMPPSSSSSSTSSPTTATPPHPARFPHHLPPLHPSLLHHLQLSSFSISSLFPSILLSHHPIPLLPQSQAFHVTPLTPLSSVTLQPLNPQPFMDRAWPVRFQQKA